MFIPKNLPSATLLPEVISNEIAAELSAGHISGPFTLEEAHFIFDGHFRTSPLGLVKKVPGDGKWQMIRHLSKMDAEGDSTNGWLSSDDFPTCYYSASMTADFVSAFPFALPHAPCHGLVPLPCMPCHRLVCPLPCVPCHVLSCAVTCALPRAIYAATWALPWASLCCCAPCHGLVHWHVRLQFSVPLCTFHRPCLTPACRSCSGFILPCWHSGCYSRHCPSIPLLADCSSPQEISCIPLE